MNIVHENKYPVREHLISYLRDRLEAHGMMISEESLAFTAERYASKIMMNPRLNAYKLIEDDIARLTEILKQVNEH